jgi:hypothetical protein
MRHWSGLELMMILPMPPRFGLPAGAMIPANWVKSAFQAGVFPADYSMTACRNDSRA